MPKLNELIGETIFKTLAADVQVKYKDIDFVNSTEYVPKERFSQVNEEKNEYKKQIGERDKQLSGLQAKVKDNEALTNEIAALKATNETAKTEYESKITKIQQDTIINNALKGSKAKDIKILRSLIDADKIKINGEEVVGLNEQIEAIKKEKDYLFEKEVPGTGSFVTGGKGENPVVVPLGEKLAKQKAAAMVNTEEQNKFFK